MSRRKPQPARLAHHNDSDSSSYSYSSSDEEDMDAPKPMAARRVAGAARQNQQKKQEAVTALTNVIATPTVGHIVAAGLHKLPEVRTLTFKIGTSVPLRVLAAQADKGRALRLRDKRGFTATYSHEEDTTDAAIAQGAIEIVNGIVTAQLAHAAGCPLLCTVTNVPLQKGHVTANVLSLQSKDAPHGKLSFALEGTGKKEEFERGLDHQQAAYLNLFPLESSQKVEQMAYPTPKNPNKMHVLVPSEVMYFYNKIAAKPITAADAENLAYGDTEHVKKAMEMTRKAREDRIAACSLTNRKALELVIEMAPESKRVAENRDDQLVGKSLYQHFYDKAAAIKDAKRSPDDFEIKLNGTIVIPYFRSTKASAAITELTALIAGTQS